MNEKTFLGTILTLIEFLFVSPSWLVHGVFYFRQNLDISYEQHLNLYCTKCFTLFLTNIYIYLVYSQYILSFYIPMMRTNKFVLPHFLMLVSQLETEKWKTSHSEATLVIIYHIYAVGPSLFCPYFLLDFHFRSPCALVTMCSGHHVLWSPCALVTMCSGHHVLLSPCILVKLLPALSTYIMLIQCM